MRSARRLLSSAQKYNFCTTLHTSDDFIKTNFYKKYRSITSQRRGFGYWLWKPYYILQMLDQMKEGELLVYADAGLEFVADPIPLVNLLQKQPLVLFENYQGFFFIQETNLTFSEFNYYREINKIKYWTKADAIDLMKVPEHFLEQPSVDASIILIRKCNSSVEILSEWFQYCKIEQILTDSASHLKNLKTFLEHRHDQSVLSLIAAKHQVRLFRCASQFGNHFKKLGYRTEGEYKILPYNDTYNNESDYPTIIEHHRDRFQLFPKRLKSFLEKEWMYFKERRY